MPNLSHLKPGDHIAIAADNHWALSCSPRLTHRIYRISRLTPTQIKAVNIDTDGVTSERTVRIADGVVIGERCGTYVRAIEATEQILAQHQAEVAAINRYHQARRQLDGLIGKELHQLKLTTEQMEHLGKAWAEVQAMAPGKNAA